MHLQGSLFGDKLHALCYRPGVALGLISLYKELDPGCCVRCHAVLTRGGVAGGAAACLWGVQWGADELPRGLCRPVTQIKYS